MEELLNSLSHALEYSTISNMELFGISIWWVVGPIAVVIGLIEFGFFLYMELHMRPKANIRLPHKEYRDYGKKRHKYFLKIMERIVRQSRLTDTDPLFNCCMYMYQWFEYNPTKRPDGTVLPPANLDPNKKYSLNGNISDLSDDDSNEEPDESLELLRYAMEALKKDDADAWICWAMFGKYRHELVDWEERELAIVHERIEDEFGLAFKPGSGNTYTPKIRLALDDCEAVHRPLMLYGAIYAAKLCSYFILKLMGFQLYVTRSGVRCWYRMGDENCDLLPLLMFQGVSPGGPAPYILFILTTLARDGRSVFFFENEVVTCTLNFDSVRSEEETLYGIYEVVYKFIKDKNLSIMGHSFGSSQLTWIIHSPLRNRVKQFTILEPVSFLLSESDALVNIKKVPLKWCIDLVCEWYIRREYPWYNSELWLDDLPEDTQVIIGLAGLDPIINSTKLKNEIEFYSMENRQFAERTKLLYAKNAIHGNCLINPYAWRNIREALLQQEFQQKRRNSKCMSFRECSKLDK